MGLDATLLAILICPFTKTPLEYDKEQGELISHAAKLAFPIKDGVPNFLYESARRLEGFDPPTVIESDSHFR